MPCRKYGSLCIRPWFTCKARVITLYLLGPTYVKCENRIPPATSENLLYYFALINSCSGCTGLTSILSLTATPGFVVFVNCIAFFFAAWVRTAPDNVISFLTASAFTLRSADFNCGSFSSFARTAFSRSESLINAFKRSSLWMDGFGVPIPGCRPRSSHPIRTIVRPNNNGSNKICFPIRGDSLNGLMNVQRVCQLLTDLFLVNTWRLISTKWFCVILVGLRKVLFLSRSYRNLAVLKLMIPCKGLTEFSFETHEELHAVA